MFYINPPKGKVALHVLENCVFTRLEYLKLLDNDKTDSFSGNFECLLENSLLDGIGHFTLRLIAAASKDLWVFWIRNEESLLKRRLDHSSVRQVHRLFRTIMRHLKRREGDAGPVSKALTTTSRYLLDPRIFSHIVKEGHADDCRKYKYEVPFSAIPDLVGKRRVDLRDGNATVVCSEWKAALLCLYRNFIQEEKKRIPCAERLVWSDPRLVRMRNVIFGQMAQKLPGDGNITATNINSESRKFPLCMQNLHAILRDKHRLSHHARFQLSLFLRECGMRLEDAIDYWRQEYTEPHTCQSGCTHSWQKDERKFLYSIRHLYGLEGGRKNYKTPNCKNIRKDVPGLRYEGGCPFEHFDTIRLTALLRNSMDESLVQEWLNDTTQRTPETACSRFLKIVHGTEAEDFVVRSPVEYYSKVTSEIT